MSQVHGETVIEHLPEPELGRPVESLFISEAATEQGAHYPRNNDAYFVGRRSLGVMDGVGQSNPRTAEAATAAGASISEILEGGVPRNKTEAEALMSTALEAANHAAFGVEAQTTAAAVLVWNGTDNRRTFLTVGTVGDSFVLIHRYEQGEHDFAPRPKLRRLAPETARRKRDNEWLSIGEISFNAGNPSELAELIRHSGRYSEADYRSTPAYEESVRLAREWFESERYPARSTLGLRPKPIQQSVETIELLEGDTIILATDGITDPLTRQQINEIVTTHSPVDAVTALMHAAKHDATSARKKEDDRTVIVARVAALASPTDEDTRELARETLLADFVNQYRGLSARDEEQLRLIAPNSKIGQLALELAQTLAGECFTTQRDYQWFLTGALALAKALERTEIPSVSTPEPES